MGLNIEQTDLPGVLILTPAWFSDDRGFFQETYHAEKYREAGIDLPFVQDNHSHSSRGVLRGLHYQVMHPQAKLVYVTRGEIYDVAVDIRKGSPSFGKWFGVFLSDENHRQMYVPEGFAHGFIVMSETVDVIYKCTDKYYPPGDRGVLWSDPDLAIPWPLQHPELSPKDVGLPRLCEIADEDLPKYGLED